MIEDKKFFAIRGYIKCGTNWLCRILNLHPEIDCTGEFHWNRITAQLIQTYNESRNLSDQPELLDNTWTHLDRFIKQAMVLACDPDATWLGDRTPSHIEPSVIVGAKIFNMVRDGRDTAVSAIYHYYNNPDAYPAYRDDPEIQRRLSHFRDDPQFFRNHPIELLACPRLLEDFASNWAETVTVNRNLYVENSELPILEIRYEDLHRDTEGERKKLYEFLEVDPALAAPLEHNTQAGFETERPDQFLRKGKVGDWQNYFTPKSKRIFNQVAGEALIQYGYAESENWQVAITDVGNPVQGFKSEPVLEYASPKRAKFRPPVDATPTEDLAKKSVAATNLVRRKKMLNSNGYLDAINHEDHSMIVQGWMMLEDGAPDSVALVSPNGDVVEATQRERPDLVPHYPKDPTAVHAGYEAVVPRSKFRKGNRYEFMIVARRGKYVAFECQVVKKRADLEGLTGGPHMTNEGVLNL
jgi:hypothetical protein